MDCARLNVPTNVMIKLALLLGLSLAMSGCQKHTPDLQSGVKKPNSNFVPLTSDERESKRREYELQAQINRRKHEAIFQRQVEESERQWFEERGLKASDYRSYPKKVRQKGNYDE